MNDDKRDDTTEEYIPMCTSAANVGSRINKAKTTAELRVWLESGARFIVVGSQTGVKTPRVEEARLGDLHDITVETVMRPTRKGRRSKWSTAEALFEEVAR